MIYGDTSVMLSLYLGDAHLPRAVALFAGAEQFAWTPWQKVEFGNALRALVARGLLPAANLVGIQEGVRRSVEAGDLQPFALDSDKLWAEAERLSIAHTAKIGVRTLDLLHVAAARVLGCTDFATFDARQTGLAEAAGLRIRS
jgi:predicted nucleic acid-binding protein